jgi:hypothetical protein
VEESDVSAELTGLCRDHSFETAIDVCRRCGLEFCEICVVHPFGAKKPFCKECAMVQGGVRTHSARPAQTPRVIKKRVKEFDKMKSRMATASGPEAPALVDPVLQDWLDTAPAEADPAAAVKPSAADRAEANVPDVATVVTDDEPADGVAPPIDWSKPFG